MLMRWKLLVSGILLLIVTFVIFFPRQSAHARDVYEEKTVVRLWVAWSPTGERPDIRSEVKARLEKTVSVWFQENIPNMMPPWVLL